MFVLVSILIRLAKSVIIKCVLSSIAPLDSFYWNYRPVNPTVQQNRNKQTQPHIFDIFMLWSNDSVSFCNFPERS